MGQIDFKEFFCSPKNIELIQHDFRLENSLVKYFAFFTKDNT